MDNGDILTATSILVGAALVAVQLFLQRRWNIQKSTEEIANRFIEPTMYQHWSRIQPSVVEQRQRWEQISNDERESVLILLSYFETIGVLVLRRVVDRQILFDLFGEVVPLLRDSVVDFLPTLRAIRRSEAVYAEFELLADIFNKMRVPSRNHEQARHFIRADG